jgi:hypothetical protein
MPRDVRRSDQTEVTLRAEAGPAQKAGNGFGLSLFLRGAKRTDKRVDPVEQARLQERLKEVVERDRALVESQPVKEEVVELALDDLELHEDELDEDEWTGPFGIVDPDLETGMRSAPVVPPPALAWADSPAEPFEAPPESGTHLTTRAAPEPADEPAGQRLSQIASWIEEEIGESTEDTGPLTLDAPLDDDEAAELDAVLAAHDLVAVEPIEPAPMKANVSAGPAPREEASGPGETFNTLTMARLLATQGYKPRALAIYRELLKRTPDDAQLRAELEALQKPD